MAEKRDDETLIELDAQVDADGRAPTDVAMDWLRSEGFIARPGGTSVSQGMSRN